MTDPKLLLLLKSLSKDEIKSLDKFIQSPFFNTNSKLLELFSYLKSKYPEFNHVCLDKKNIFSMLFPGKPFSDLRTRQYLSSLTVLVEQFITICRIQKDTTTRQFALLEEMLSRDSEKYFNHTLSHVAQNGRDAYQNGEFYRNQFRLEEIRSRFIATSAQRQNRFIAQPDFSKTLHHLDTFYLIYKLKYCCEMLNFKTIGALEKETILLDEILDLLRKKDYSDTPAVNIYHKILLTLTEPDNEENFERLLQTLKSNDHLFPQSETREIYIYAQNFCIRQINKGKTRFLNEILDIYQILLEREIILEKGVLSPWDYKNIVVTALRLNEFQWTENFINDYKKKLPEHERENAYTYNLAKFYFYKKDYSNVLKLLQEVEYNDVFYSLDSKAMLLKTYYELNEVDSLDSLMDSFKIYLQRNKALSEHHVKTYKNLLRITHRLTRIIPKDKKRIELLEAEIEQTKPLADIGWLREKMEELKG